MVRRVPRMSIIWVAICGIAALSCGETKRTSTPLFSVSPQSFVFPKLDMGQSVVRYVDVTNRGTGLLRLTEIILEDDSSASEFSLFVSENGDLGPVPEALLLDAEETATLAMRYAPSDESEDGGQVRLRTNDIDTLDAVIPIRTSEQAGEIRVAPRTIDFGRVEVMETAVREMTVSNIGGFDLLINSIRLNGSPEFSVTLDDVNVLGDALSEPLVVGPGESRVFTVTFSPESPSVADSEVVIESNAVNGASVSVSLIANGAAPCLQVVPSFVEFESGLLIETDAETTPNVRTLTLESCGTAAVRIDRMIFEDPNGAFRLVNLADREPGESLYELPAAEGDGVYPSVAAEIGFFPEELGAYGGRLLVYSNAPSSPDAIEVFGRGVNNRCPSAVAASTEFDVPPLDIITLDGTPSSDPGGEIREWLWTVVERPDGSVSEPVERFADIARPADGGDADDPQTPNALFFVDLAGRYTIELQVVDDLGQPSCEPPVATVEIRVTPEKDLHVQLVWSTPMDDDPTDQFGTDVDLHFRHENASGQDLNNNGELEPEEMRWAASAGKWDCYFRNATPDWGEIGNALDNPTLDIDDTNGAGPENINLESPEEGVTYEVGAIYYRPESTFGVAGNDRRIQHPSYLTSRIYVRGELLNEFVGRELTRGRQLWHIASVTWCDEVESGGRCPEITIRDRVLEEMEYSQ